MIDRSGPARSAAVPRTGMLGRRPRPLALALVFGVIATLALAGCGVPGETRAVTDGTVIPQGEPGTGASERSPHTASDAKTDQQFVEYFLQAAAGDVDTAATRLQDFVVGGSEWQPSKAVNVVRVGRTTFLPSGGKTTFQLSLRTVGLLTESGSVDKGDDREFTLSLDVIHGEPDRDERKIANPPPAIYLDSSALDEWYLPYHIYFWDSSGNTLLPDLRYLPLSVIKQARPNKIVAWILSGPSSWLQQAVEALPPGIEQRDQVVTNGNKIVVSLSAKAQAGDLEKLVVQLRWSLAEAEPGKSVELQIERQQKAVSANDDYKAFNRAMSLGPPKGSYCVVNNVVVPVVRVADRQYCAPSQKPPPALPPEVNVKVKTAAVTRDGERAAVVQQVGGNQQKLVVSQHLNQPASRAEDRPRNEIGRPVWLHFNTSIARGLVPMDGQLYEFLVNPRGILTTRVVQGAPSNVTAVAVAPDDQRVALVANGAAYVAPIAFGNDGTSLLGEPRSLQTSVGRLVGIGWSRQDRVVVAAGDNDGPAVAELTVDGAIEKKFTVDLGPLKITRLAAFPVSPAPEIGDETLPVLVETTNSVGSWIFYNTSKQELQLETARNGAAPSPSGSTSTNTTTQGGTPVAVTAPFYAD